MVDVEWVEGKLGVQFVHLREEVASIALLNLLSVVQEEKAYARVSAHEGRHEPLVELVDALEVHVRRHPNVLVHQVQRSVGDELRQVAVVEAVIAPFRAVLQLEEWIVRLPHDDEVVGVSGGAHRLRLADDDAYPLRSKLATKAVLFWWR